MSDPPRDSDLMQGLSGAASLSHAVNAPGEREWVRRAQAGDPAAVEQLVKSQLQRVERLLQRVLGPRQDLEDLVQITMLETLRALPSFRHESALSTFVAGIAVRVARRAMRPTKVQRGARALDDAGELQATAPGPEVSARGAEALRRLRAILERVSEPKRVAFMLWAVEGMAVEDVASAMQASVSATRSRIFYAQTEIKSRAAEDPCLREWLEEREVST